MKYNFFSLLTVSCIFFSTLIGIAILLKNKRSRQINLPLVLFMFSINLSLFSVGFLVYTGNYRIFPHLLSYSSIATFLIGPFFHIYIRQVLFPKEKIRKFLYFIPAIIVFCLTIPYQLKPGYEKVMLLDKLFTGQLTFVESLFCGSFSILGLFSTFLYFIHSWFLLRKKKWIIKQSGTSKTVKLQSWVVYTVYNNLIVIVIFMIIAIISMLDDFNVNILYKSVPETAGFFTCLLGVRILFQPEFFLLDNTDFFSSSMQPDTLYIIGEAMKGRIMTAISANEFYKDPDLTLNDLSRKIGVSRTALSKTINSAFNMNFYDFINRFRVNAIKEKIRKDPWNTNILDAAFKSGFKSKTTFNVCFKRYENMTPTQFKNQLLEKQQTAAMG